MPRTWSRGSAWTALLPLLLILAPGPVPAAGQAEAEGLSVSFRQAARRVLPAVVTVRAAAAPGPIEPLDPFGGLVPGGAEPVAPPRDGGGSGVVIDAARGLVLTNDHVVQASSRIVVALPDGRQRPAREIRRDPKSDLAVLTIDPQGLQQAEWGDSEALEIGDWVLAIGQPFGLSGTVTAGIVSGKGRGLGESTYYEDLIQTDAAINPGNSGGPLVNLRGEVVGINSVIKTISGGDEGVGFAVPAARARRIAADLVAFGRVRRSVIGIRIGRLDPEAAARLGRPGAVPISAVTPEGPAAAAGLRPGDLVVGLGGKPVQGIGMLQAAIEIAPVDAPLTLTILRDGQARDVPVRPVPQADVLGLPGPLTVPTEPAVRPPDVVPGPVPREELESRTPSRFPALGLRLEEPTPALARRFDLDPAVQGLVVVGVEPDGPADRGGLELGMVITDVAERKVTTLAAFRAALALRSPERDLVLRVLKGAKAEFRVLLLQEVAQD